VHDGGTAGGLAIVTRSARESPDTRRRKNKRARCPGEAPRPANSDVQIRAKALVYRDGQYVERPEN
jgi:hypothetical protein